jgi:hypothetical protein
VDAGDEPDDETGRVLAKDRSRKAPCTWSEVSTFLSFLPGMVQDGAKVDLPHLVVRPVGTEN